MWAVLCTAFNCPAMHVSSEDEMPEKKVRPKAIEMNVFVSNSPEAKTSVEKQEPKIVYLGTFSDTQFKLYKTEDPPDKNNAVKPT